MSYNSTNIGKVIYALCGSTIEPYPVRAPQSTAAPYLVYNILTNDPDDIKESVAPVHVVTVLVSIYESTYALCQSKADSIMTAMDGKGGTIGGIAVDSVVFVTESDDYEDELKLYIKTQEYRFRIKNLQASVDPFTTAITENITSNSGISTVIKGYMLLTIIVTIATEPTSAVFVNIGTTPTGSDIASNKELEVGPAATIINYNAVVSYTESKNIYINSSSWKGAKINVIMISTDVTP